MTPADIARARELGDERLPSRFWAKVTPVSSGCWLWTGYLLRGYGRYWTGGAMALAHRAAYEALVGLIPGDRELDHRCRNRPCVNPMHLEPVTRLENILRGDGPSVLRALNGRKTHCPAGHEYTEENTARRRGRRYCRACERIRDARRRSV